MWKSPENSPPDRIRHLEEQLIKARTEISNLRQQVKTLNYVHRKECEEIRGKLEGWRCLGCREDPGGAAAPPDLDFSMKQIGVVSTNFPEKRGTPRQAGVCGGAVAKLTLNNEVFTNPEHALEGLEEFSHLWVLFLFHKNDSTHVRAKVAPPRLNGARTGVFATRSPHRPTPIGLSLVKIERIAGNVIYFTGVDMVDQTPVVDIKPYIPQYDCPSGLGPEERESNGVGEALPDGQENGGRMDVVGAVARSGSRLALDELSYTRLASRIGEREAPDGEEEEPPDPLPVPMTPEGHIRVPSWIDNPPVPTLSVTFKDRALSQIAQLGAEGEEKKRIITNVLREDPRSVYLRDRWGSHCYVFRISELYVSCKFSDGDHSVTVFQVFQNSPPEDE